MFLTQLGFIRKFRPKWFHKIDSSCVTWSSFHKSTLASSDYDCTVVVWDANTAQKMRMYQVRASS
jgi:WD40 repeat protein